MSRRGGAGEERTFHKILLHSTYELASEVEKVNVWSV